MKRTSLLGIFVFGLVSATTTFAETSQILQCDGNAIVITRTKMGSPENGHGYWATKAVFNNRDIVRFLVSKSALNLGTFHPDWNDAFYTLDNLVQRDDAGNYQSDEYISEGGYNPNEHLNRILLTRNGSGLRFEAYAIVGHYNGGAPILGNLLADWGFQSCN